MTIRSALLFTAGVLTLPSSAVAMGPGGGGTGGACNPQYAVGCGLYAFLPTTGPDAGFNTTGNSDYEFYDQCSTTGWVGGDQTWALQAADFAPGTEVVVAVQPHPVDWAVLAAEGAAGRKEAL